VKVNIQRRNFLLAGSAIGLIALTSCSGVSATSLQSDAQLVETALQTIDQEVVALGPLWLPQFNNYYSVIESFVSLVANSTTVPVASTVSVGVTAIENLYNLVKPNANLPPAVVDALEAIESLTPVFLAAVGLVGASNRKHKYDVPTARAKLKAIKAAKGL